MPPLPDPLHEETLLKLDKLRRRIEDAQSFQVARLHDHTGSVAVQQQYAAELREDIESYRRELEVVSNSKLKSLSRYSCSLLCISQDSRDICGRHPKR